MATYHTPALLDTKCEWYTCCVVLFKSPFFHLNQTRNIFTFKLQVSIKWFIGILIFCQKVQMTIESNLKNHVNALNTTFIQLCKTLCPESENLWVSVIFGHLLFLGLFKIFKTCKWAWLWYSMILWVCSSWACCQF